MFYQAIGAQPAEPAASARGRISWWTVFEELTADIRRWSAPHPEWQPRVAWAREVASFAVSAGEDLVLVDPLVPADEEPFWAVLDRLASGGGDGRDRLERALQAPPWSMRSG